MRTYRVAQYRNMYLISRPIGQGGEWTSHRTISMEFTEDELRFNPWEHLVDIPEDVRRAAGPGALRRGFSGSCWIFHRDGIEYHSQWCDTRVFVDGVDYGMTGSAPYG